MPESPAVYLGLETIGDRLDRLSVLVPHEFNHLVRLAEHLRRTGDLRAFDILGERIIAEGLATLTPLVVSETEITPESLARALMMPEESFAHCERNWPELWRRAHSAWGERTTPELMTRFLVGTDRGWVDGVPERSGCRADHGSLAVPWQRTVGAAGGGGVWDAVAHSAAARAGHAGVRGVARRTRWRVGHGGL